MKRLLMGLCTAAMVGLPATPAGAAPPNIYHTISNTHGFAHVVNTTGCEQTEVFVSSMAAMYAAQPGPVNKQGLTAVSVRITDICAQPAGDIGAAAAGGVVLFQADGQNLTPLLADPRLTTASITTEMPGTDGSGNAVTISLAATWTGKGPLEHSTVHNHVHYPGEGNVSATDNNLSRAATASVSVAVDGLAISGTDSSEALLTRTKSRCIEVARPGVEEFFPCFGFPG
ncbi:hypothetical protein FJ661_18365 [Pseudarthrobacter phenanthrenivorans]|uniref:hypothetical protein n=1 Tax=Pseudarthrobacter phenanthrenivorans TaxID=361575 RepID=UPI00112E0609|nr:hypothetical protein [Pseudarthrobacter phenanthrenivorans]TPV48619.1 hypothetical protein FJ661_18365 [Pseudarthrobacter phenanthrenivorans]